ncbi:MAG: hydrogenase expression/formation protein HypE [Clostridiaceae bacterium]
MGDKVLLSHGSGGKQTNKLINELFLKYFNNEVLNELNDAAHLILYNSNIVFTTDSFVVNPVFFNGGDIGKLSICGTVNDIAVSGAKPLFLSSAFIIEEGFPLEKLETIVKSMADEAKKAGVKIVTGDTKVVNKGSADGIFINTTGIGIKYNGVNISSNNAKPGDVVIVNGSLGDHGIAIMCERNNLGIEGNLKSDCASLNTLVDSILKVSPNTHVIRDATRGGIAAVLNEIAEMSKITIAIEEKAVPVKEEVSGVCQILGLDPLYIANEGKICVFVPEEYAESVLNEMKKHPLGVDSSIIGGVTEYRNSRVYIDTIIGGKRIVDMPSGDQLPRIC